MLGVKQRISFSVSSTVSRAPSRRSRIRASSISITCPVNLSSLIGFFSILEEAFIPGSAKDSGRYPYRAGLEQDPD
jgi:hypothetical protein